MWLIAASRKLAKTSECATMGAEEARFARTNAGGASCGDPAVPFGRAPGPIYTNIEGESLASPFLRGM